MLRPYGLRFRASHRLAGLFTDGMSRITRIIVTQGLLLLAAVCACRTYAPPVAFWGQSDHLHYAKLSAAVAIPIEEVDIDADGPPRQPVTLRNFHEQRLWDLPLEEALRLALANSRIVRQLP